jgi:hypothetical protein
LEQQEGVVGGDRKPAAALGVQARRQAAALGKTAEEGCRRLEKGSKEAGSRHQPLEQQERVEEGWRVGIQPLEQQERGVEARRQGGNP